MTYICHMPRRATGADRGPLYNLHNGAALPRATRRCSRCRGVSDAWPCAQDLVREGEVGTYRRIGSAAGEAGEDRTDSPVGNAPVAPSERVPRPRPTLARRRASGAPMMAVAWSGTCTSWKRWPPSGCRRVDARGHGRWRCRLLTRTVGGRTTALALAPVLSVEPRLCGLFWTMAPGPWPLDHGPARIPANSLEPAITPAEQTS